MTKVVYELAEAPSDDAALHVSLSLSPAPGSAIDLVCKAQCSPGGIHKCTILRMRNDGIISTPVRPGWCPLQWLRETSRARKAMELLESKGITVQPCPPGAPNDWRATTAKGPYNTWWYSDTPVGAILKAAGEEGGESDA